MGEVVVFSIVVEDVKAVEKAQEVGDTTGVEPSSMEMSYYAVFNIVIAKAKAED